MKSKKILVTGASGFIGSNLSKRLEKEGYSLILIDDFSRGKKEYLKYLKVKTPCTKMDLREYTNFKEYFEDADTVFHCAGRIGGNQFLHGSVKNELITLQDNLAIDRNVFKACCENNVKKIIFTSSVSVYNTKRQYDREARFLEDDLKYFPIDPEGGYGWAKFIAEKQLEMMSHGKTKVGIARIFKSYGPCDDYSDESGQVVCSLIRKAINYPEERYVLWGDGLVERCLVYIDDLIDGLIKLSNYCDKESLSVNLGGNISYSMRYLASRIADLSGKRLDIENDMGKPVGVRSRIPDLSLAKEKLNWEPTTSLENGLKKTYEWMKYELQ